MPVQIPVVPAPLCDKPQTCRKPGSEARNGPCHPADNEIVRIFSDRGSVNIPIKYSKNVKRGILRTTFHQPEVFINIITGSVGDKETLTPEYKVVAVDFERVEQ